MSKTKIKHIYVVRPVTGKEFYVSARSPKGARSIAQNHGYDVAPLVSGQDHITRTGDQFANIAINRKTD